VICGGGGNTAAGSDVVTGGDNEVANRPEVPMSRKSLTRRLRESRQSREFERALRNASPAMQQELLAAAARRGVR